ncbi:T9SS type A sorting domain-containing protein, partial [bacterium]|nr:T9SS type A sorting domain-containing protein [bacterium]
ANRGRVSLKIFDVLGREVQVLVDGVQNAGSHTVIFNGSGLAAGIYFYRLQTGEFSETKKMVLLK